MELSLDRLMLIGAVSVALIALGRAPKVIRQWCTLPRLYGDVPYTLAMEIANYASFGRVVSLQRITSAVFWVGAATVITFSYFASALITPSTAASFAIACLLLHIVAKFEVGTPPAILLLGPSSRELLDELHSLSTNLPNHRTIVLSRPTVGTPRLQLRW